MKLVQKIIRFLSIIITVIGWIRYSSSTDSPVTFPEFQNETIYSSTRSAQITIPPELLRERKAEGGTYEGLCVTI